MGERSVQLPAGVGPGPVGSAKSQPEGPLRDLQLLLSSAVARIRVATGAETVIAWALRDDATPYVVAAAFGDDPPESPTRQEYEALASRSGPVRLDECEPLAEIASRHGVAAAVSVAPAEDPIRRAEAILLVGPEPLRPRALAALARAATQLARPLAGSAAARRLAALDREVRQLDRLAALGSLATEIAHEVRNPLVSIKTFLQLLPERWGDPEFSEQFRHLVDEEVRRMERLLDVVIRHARPDGATADQRRGDVADAIDSSCELLLHRAHKRGVRVDRTLATDLPDVALADDALRQVVLNLLLNAIEATPASGRVELSARRLAAGGVELCACDEGPGIPPERREHIFEAFDSTRMERPGGLGLSITRRIVVEAGGTIEASATDSGGAKLTVTLPAAKPG